MSSAAFPLRISKESWRILMACMGFTSRHTEFCWDRKHLPGYHLGHWNNGISRWKKCGLCHVPKDLQYAFAFGLKRDLYGICDFWWLHLCDRDLKRSQTAFDHLFGWWRGRGWACKWPSLEASVIGPGTGQGAPRKSSFSKCLLGRSQLWVLTENLLSYLLEGAKRSRIVKSNK